MAGRENEAVAIRPYRVGRIEAKELLPEAVSYRRHCHGCSRMPGIGGLHCIHRECPDGVDAGQIHRLTDAANFAKAVAVLMETPLRFHAAGQRHPVISGGSMPC